jgi:hypothetical protein
VRPPPSEGSNPWQRHNRHDDTAVVEAIVPGHGRPGVARPSTLDAICQRASDAFAGPHAQPHDWCSLAVDLRRTATAASCLAGERGGERL